MKAWRHDFHKHPELGFNEERTSRKIASILEEFGLKVFTGIGKTGVVAVLRNGKSKRAIGFRADMDGLPIQEENNFSYRSIYDNVFHGCGHDGHSAMLLGAAYTLSRQKDSLHGTLYFIFQPNEENGKGALAMIDDGLFKRFSMQEIYGLHNMPGLPAGKFVVREGSIMTSESIFVITIKGRGGHASMPSRTIDPIVIAAEIVLTLQTIVSRSVDPEEWGVLSVTEIDTDGARNVIPSKVIIKGDCRALKTDTQRKIETRMRKIVRGICLAHGATGKVEYNDEFIVTMNSPNETKAAINAAQKVSGNLQVDTNCPPCGASEDFARMLEKKPGCYILLGNGNQGHCGRSLHNPHYDLNDKILTTGCNYWVALAKERLADPQSTQVKT